MRLGVDKEVFLFNSRGEEATVRLLEIKGIDLNFEVLSVKKLKESVVKVALYASLLKKDNFELVIQKATEAGVFEITPIVTARTVNMA